MNIINMKRKTILIIQIIGFISFLIILSPYYSWLKDNMILYNLSLLVLMVSIALALYSFLNDIIQSWKNNLIKVLFVTVLLFVLPVIFLNSTTIIKFDNPLKENLVINYSLCFMLNILYFVLNKELVLEYEQLFKASLIFAVSLYSLVISIIELVNPLGSIIKLPYKYYFGFVISGLAICRGIIEYYKIKISNK